MEPLSPGLIVLLLWILRAWWSHQSRQETPLVFPPPDSTSQYCQNCGVPYNPADYVPGVAHYCSRCKAPLTQDVAPPALPVISNAGGPMTEKELNDFCTKYYLSPSPERIPELLAYDIQSWWLFDTDKSTMWYFFARIAQDHPFLVREYEELFRKHRAARSALLLMLIQAGDQQTRLFLEACLEDPEFKDSWKEIRNLLRIVPGSLQPLSQPIHTLADLDRLWFEFLATGNTAALIRLVDVLEWPDRILTLLESSLKMNSRRKEITRRLWKDASILCRSETGEVLSAQDLDCHFALNQLNFDQDRFKKFLALLPMPFEGDLNYVSVKAAAKWSLASNAKQHSLVLSAVEAEAAKRKGRCRIALLEIAASAHIAQNDLGPAFNALEESLSVDPEDQNGQLLKARAEYDRLERLSIDDCCFRGRQVGLREAAAECARATEGARTYRSKLTLRYGEQPSSREVEWEFQYSRPGVFRVFQKAGNDYDEWLTFEEAHLRGPVYAAIQGDYEKKDRTINRGLMAERWSGILRYAPVSRMGTDHSEPGNRVVYEYKHLVPPGASTVALASRFKWAHSFLPRIWRTWSMHLDIITRATSIQAQLWEDCNTGFLAKAVVALTLTSASGIPQKIEVVQVFSCYNEPVSIIPPPFQVVQT